jgi:hypothetical protein
VLTQEGEGYIHSEVVKRFPTDVLYGLHSIYTTCNLPNPHFYIATSRIKLIPGKSIVTGPADLVVEGVPTPLFLPFGLFPINEKRKSGIIFPEYGEDLNRGFFLRQGGYYFGLSDHLDLALTGDIYSRGSWAVNVASRFVKRYKYSGGLQFTYTDLRDFQSETNSYTSSKQFNFSASLREDTKARPNSHFNANVAFGSSGFNRNYASYDNYINNTYQSSISYYQIFPYSPFNLTVSASHSQSTLTHIVNVQLPSLAFNMNQIYPFRRKEQVGSQKWYERIGLSYTLNAINNLSGIDSTFFSPNSLNKFTTGFQHQIPVSAPFQLFKYFTVTPAFNYTETWSLQTVRQMWDPDSERILLDTVKGFASTRQFNFSISGSTRLYGMVKFHGKLKAIRHVFTPTVAFSFQPDFSDPQWNTYRTVQTDAEGTTSRYSIFSGAVYGGPGPGSLGGISVNLGNNLEMKVFSKKTPSPNKKK